MLKLLKKMFKMMKNFEIVTTTQNETKMNEIMKKLYFLRYFQSIFKKNWVIFRTFDKN